MRNFNFLYLISMQQTSGYIKQNNAQKVVRTFIRNAIKFFCKLQIDLRQSECKKGPKIVLIFNFQLFGGKNPTNIII